MNFNLPLFDSEPCSCCTISKSVKENNITKQKVNRIETLDDYTNNSLTVTYFDTNNPKTQTIPTGITQTLLNM